MRGLRNLIVEIHRRSLWQVLAVYVATSWFVLQASEHVVNRYLLPEWFYGAALVLLLIGLPIVLATAIVREEPVSSASSRHEPVSSASSRHEPAPSPPPEASEARSGESGPWAAATSGAAPATAPGSDPLFGPLASLLTWPRAIAGGVMAFLALALVSGFIVAQGMPRVTAAQGTAGDAFGERGWIVLAEVETAGDDEVPVARALREALSVDLQQSSFSNLLSHSQTASILQRMGLPDTTRLELPLALEVAERAGAGAVLGVAVSQVGHQYLLSARALHVGTREELFAVRAAAGSDRLLDGIETLSREVRRRLGEEREAVRRSRPLPEVTTPSLEALRLYAEGEAAMESEDYDRAVALLDEALVLDPEFAMALRLQGVIASNRQLLSEADRFMARAYANRNRLSDRERLHVEAYHNLQVVGAPHRAVEAYERLLARYPDDWRAVNNIGVALGDWLSEPDRAHPWIIRAWEMDQLSVLSLFNAIGSHFWAGNVEEVDRLERLAEEEGHGDRLLRWWIGRSFVEADYARTAELCEAIGTGDRRSLGVAVHVERCAAMDLARGRHRAGRAAMEEMIQFYRDRGLHRRWMESAGALALAHPTPGERVGGAAHVEAFLEEVGPEAIPEPDRSIVHADLEVTAALLGRWDLLERIEEKGYVFPETGHVLVRAGRALATAARAVAAGDGEEALAALRAAGRPPSGWRIFDEVLRGLAFDLTGQVDSTAYHLERAVDPGLPPGTRSLSLYPLALRRLAEVEEARGDPEGAARAWSRLQALWADADPELTGPLTASGGVP